MIPDAAQKTPQRDEWLVVLGGSGMVGRSAIQVHLFVLGFSFLNHFYYLLNMSRFFF